MSLACLGGWCLKRDNCDNYHSADRREPSERLCIPGEDGKSLDAPVVIRMPVGSWERKSEVVQ